jgi:general stress protein 26
MDVWGQGSVITDKTQIKDKWSPVVKAYFPEGVEDPNLALLRVQPNNVYYWESETGKMVQYLKMATAAVTGNPAVAKGAEGTINL